MTILKRLSFVGNRPTLAPEYQVRGVTHPHVARVKLIAKWAVQPDIESIDLLREKRAVPVAKLTGNGNSFKSDEIFGLDYAHPNLVLK